MFAVACAALSLAGPLQGPRWEVVRAAARYDALLVKPPAGAPLLVQHRAAQLTDLVRFLQLEARELWRLGLRGGATRNWTRPPSSTCCKRPGTS